MTERRAVEQAGVVLGLVEVLWAVNAFAVWVFSYPVVYCAGDALATDTVREGYELIGALLIVFFIISLVLKGAQSLPVSVLMIFLYAIAPPWFGVIFKGAVGCG